MPVPTTIDQLSTTAASNYPSGSDSPATLDDVQRAHGAFIAQIRDGVQVTNAAAKTTPIDADYLPINDSAASNLIKKVTWAIVKATLKTYFDTLYAVSGSYAASGANADITSLTALASVPTVVTTAINSKKLAQIVTYQTGAVATGTTVLPYDDTIPQNTEGNEYMTLAITPTNSGSTLEIDVEWIGCSSVTNNIGVALFQDSTANALSVVQSLNANSVSLLPIPLKHVMTAGTTSATTFKVRAGGGSAGTTTFNGVGGARYFGGLIASRITIKEYLP